VSAQRLLITGLLALGVPTLGAAQTNEWTTWGYDAERSGWNRAETTLDRSNVAGLAVQWSVQLPTPVVDVVLSTLTAPVLASAVKTRRGNKNLLYLLGSNDTLYALDADSGATVWRRQFTNAVKANKIATWLCSNTANATPVIDKSRGLIFFMASDGKLRAHDLRDGAERMAPVEMVAPFARAWSLNLIDNVVYTTSGRACGEIQDPRSISAAASVVARRRIGADGSSLMTDPSVVTAVDVSDLERPEVTRFFLSGGRPAAPWGRGGLARGPGSSLIVETSDGLFDPASGNWGDSVMRLSPKAARVMDSFTPANHLYIQSKDLAGSASPVVFAFGNRTLVAQAQKEAVLYLLDANDLGGGIAASHARPLFKSAPLGNDLASGTDPSQGVWGAITTYATPDGRRFLYVPLWGPPSKDAPVFPVSGGAAHNGGIMAFEVLAEGEGVTAAPRWISSDMIMPDPPVVANGVVYATSTGGQALQNPRKPDGSPFANTTPESIRNRSTPVGNLILYAFDAQTGQQLYSSGTTISDWVHFSEPVVALGKVFLVTHDAHVYAFGIGRVDTNRPVGM
jgi:outer membrane protein assembly factor BamB